MKVIAVIPARYDSSRFPKKPLADIHGKPMIWWVYQQVKKAKRIERVVVATDHDTIYSVCVDLGIDVIMTRNDHPTSTERVQEVSKSIKADLYVVINGDEPLIDPVTIEKIIPENVPTDGFFVSNIMTEIKNPVEVVDFTNIKVVVGTNGNAMYFSRSPIPYPKSSLDYAYYKHVGILAYTQQALDFFAETPKGPIEKVEDVNELRFVEHEKPIKMVKVDCSSLSVDTPKDLEQIKKIITERGITV